MTKQIYKIDATGKVLGRVASEAALLLRGKNDPRFARHLAPDISLEINHVSRLKLPADKLKTKTYTRYSGYPGGLKFLTLEQVVDKKGYAEPLRLAIRGMLPRNKLRGRLMARLKINE